jgi:hypothetical protein
MAWNLVPREHKFFDDFYAVTVELRKGAQLLNDLLSTDPPRWELADAIKAVEHRCDQLTHDIFQRLNQTFVTPLDREDIHALASSLDDVMDAIDGAAGYVRLYRLEKVRAGARAMAAIILQSTEELHRAMQRLGKRQAVLESVVEINRLENEADHLHSQLMAQLFEEERDPIMIIKWRDVFDYLENASDRCEDVANVLETVVVKYA